MCVSCMLYIDWELEGWKNLWVGISLGKKLVRVGLQEINNFFRPNHDHDQSHHPNKYHHRHFYHLNEYH